MLLIPLPLLLINLLAAALTPRPVRAVASIVVGGCLLSVGLGPIGPLFLGYGLWLITHLRRPA